MSAPSEEITSQILAWLNKIEQEHQITIIYAVESGSRAWGMASPDSDYDVRFIYVGKQITDYLLEKVPETVTIFSQDRLLDFGGWEIRKALRLLVKGNGSIVEWLSSPIVYLNRDNAIEKIKRLAFHRRSVMKSYHGLAKSMENHSYTPTGVILKKYFYIIRPIAMLQWYMENPPNQTNQTQVVPPIILPDLLEQLKTIDPVEKKAILDLIERKSKLNEGTRDIPKDSIIETWLEKIRVQFQKIESDESILGSRQIDNQNKEQCDRLIIDLINSFSTKP